MINRKKQAMNLIKCKIVKKIKISINKMNYPFFFNNKLNLNDLVIGKTNNRIHFMI